MVILSLRMRRLGLIDAHNGLRTFNRTMAEQSNLHMNGISHISEFVEVIDSRGWRTTEQLVDTFYTEYSISKDQSLFDDVNILADSLVSKGLS